MLLAGQAGKLEYPAFFFLQLFGGDTIDTSKELEIFLDGQIVVEGKFLGHVTDLLADAHGAKGFGLAGKLHGAVGRLEEATEHFDGGGFAGTVGAEESVNFAVVDLQADVVDGSERAELLGEAASADADLAAEITVGVATGKRFIGGAFAEFAKRGDESVFQRGLIDVEIVDGQVILAHHELDFGGGVVGILRKQIEAVAETLRIEDDALVGLGKDAQSFLKFGSPQFETLGAERAADFVWGTDLADFALMDERDAMTAFGFVEIGSGDDDGEAFSGEVRDSVPKFAAGNGIDAGGGFIEEKDVRLGNEGADEG